MARFLLNNHEFDKNIPGKNWEWKIVTEEELREMLDGWEFGVFGNGFANVGIDMLRDDLGKYGRVYPVSVYYGKNGWSVRDVVGKVFLREEVEDEVP